MSNNQDSFEMIYSIRKIVFIAMFLLVIARKRINGYSDPGFLVCMAVFQFALHFTQWRKNHEERELYLIVFWLFCTAMLFCLFCLTEIHVR